MSELPQPVTNTEVYLNELCKSLVVIQQQLSVVAKELQTFNANATQKPTINLDVNKLADAIKHVNKLKP